MPVAPARVAGARRAREGHGGRNSSFGRGSCPQPVDGPPAPASGGAKGHRGCASPSLVAGGDLVVSLTPFSAPLSCAPFPAGPGSRSPALSPPSSRPPGAEAPANREVPPFPPVRVRGGRYRLSPMGGRARGRRRALAAGLAVTAVALVAAGPRIGDPVRGHPSEGSGAGASARAQSAMRAPAPSARAARKVSAPVRIADAAAVRLLRPGDRVDVIAAEQTARGPRPGWSPVERSSPRCPSRWTPGPGAPGRAVTRARWSSCRCPGQPRHAWRRERRCATVGDPVVTSSPPSGNLAGRACRALT